MSSILHIDTAVVLPGEGALRQAVEVFPSQGVARAILVCLPGGGMTRRYYDLQAGTDETFSFARQMSQRGFIVVTADYLGLGDSDKPADGYALTHEVLTQANATVVRHVLAELRAGRIDGIAANTLPAFGVGHSMGGMMTTLLQAAAEPYAGIALLGFGTRGLPEYLMPEIRDLALQDIAAARDRVEEFARKMFGNQSYPVIKPTPQSNSIYGGKAAEPAGVEALKAAYAPLLPFTAYLSMLPGNVAAEAARITVPVFLGLGERDMAGPPHQIPAAFTASMDVSLHILPLAGHSHFVFASRTGLFDRLARWATSFI